MADLPAELKQLKRFIREAKKTEKVSPVIAYYCRLYAIQEAMKLDESKKTPTTKKWLSDQMTALEQNKVDVSREEAKLKITTMAHNVFKHADEVDRAGNANKTTAAAFNSAFVFYTILKQFGDRDEQIVEAAKYCMFKTTDILKAIKEGRKPKPGPPGDEPDVDDADLNAELNAMGSGGGGGAADGGGFANANEQNFAQPSPQPQQPSSPPSYGNNNNYNQPPSQPTYNQPGYNQPSYQQPAQPQANYNQPPPQAQQSTFSQSYSTPSYNYQKNVNLPQYENKVQACVAAEKMLKEAMAALRFEDVDTAIKKAEEAIATMQPHNH